MIVSRSDGANRSDPPTHCVDTARWAHYPHGTMSNRRLHTQPALHRMLPLVVLFLVFFGGAAGPATDAPGDNRIYTFGVLLEAMAQLNRTFDRSLREHAGINQSLFEGLLRIERSGGQLSMGELADQVALGIAARW